MSNCSGDEERRPSMSMEDYDKSVNLSLKTCVLNLVIKGPIPKDSPSVERKMELLTRTSRG